MCKYPHMRLFTEKYQSIFNCSLCYVFFLEIICQVKQAGKINTLPISKAQANASIVLKDPLWSIKEYMIFLILLLNWSPLIEY